MALRVLTPELLLNLLWLSLTTYRLLLERSLAESDLPVLVWHLVVAQEVHTDLPLINLLTYNDPRLGIHYHIIRNRLRSKSKSKILDLNFIFMVN